MPLIAAKCTNCGGILEVDASKDAAICPHCGSAFITEKAINNYNTYQNTYNQIHADTIIMQDAGQKDFEIAGGILKSYRGENLDVVIPENVFEIGDSCFENMYIRSVVVPKGARIIGDKAFANCVNLEKIVLPESLKQIKHRAFLGCESLKELILPAGCQVGEALCVNCYELERAVLPEGLEIIPRHMFYQCRKLQEVSVPGTVVQIIDNAFEGCSGLSGFPFVEKLEDIGYEAFKNCSNLRTFPLPDGMKVLRYGAFSNCTSLQMIRIPESMPAGSIGNECFSGCSSLERIISTSGHYDIDNMSYASACEWLRGTPVLVGVQRQEWIRRGLCPDCGGEPVGFFRTKCSRCGRPF